MLTAQIQVCINNFRKNQRNETKLSQGSAKVP